MVSSALLRSCARCVVPSPTSAGILFGGYHCSMVFGRLVARGTVSVYAVV
jgi:hypothetical protein